MLEHREELGVRVAVISFAAPASLAAYRDRFDLGDAVLLSDEDRAAYVAFGFERGSAARVWLSPRVWWRYARLHPRAQRRHQSPREAHADRDAGPNPLTAARRSASAGRSSGPALR